MSGKWSKKEFKILLGEEALKWVGTPYKHMGKTKNGCDCLGLVIGILENLGIEIPEAMYAKYSFNWNMGNPYVYEGNIKKHCTVINSGKETGNLCAFKIKNPGINHIGIWLTNYTFIHSCALNRTTEISNIKDRFWKNHYTDNLRINLLSEYIKV